MKKHILSCVMALICVISASATQKMYVETTSGDGILTTVIEASLVDSAFHWENTSSRSVKAHVGRRIPYEFPQNTIKRVYFTPESKDISGTLVSTSFCIDSKSTDEDKIPSMSFQYNPESMQLSLTFTKLRGNCCQNPWLLLLSYKGDTIYVEPKETIKDACDCVCENTATFTLDNIEARKYHFVTMDYSDGFDIDLTESTEGKVLHAPKGVFMGKSKCLNDEYLEKTEAGEIDNIQDLSWNPTNLRVKEADTLVSYQYDPELHELTIVSHGLVFNCCSQLSTTTTFKGNTIYISTEEQGISFCDCMCIYNSTTKVKNVEAKKYRFFVDGDEFEVDFSQSTEGAILRQ